MNARVEEKPEGAPEWMVSFADMITIMMSFFVIMFAIASGEAAKGKRSQQQEAILTSLQNRFGPTYQPFASWGLTSGDQPIPRSGKPEKGILHRTAQQEDSGPTKVLKKERARIRVPGRGDRTVIGGVVSFEGMSVDLTAKQKTWLGVIAGEMAGIPQQIQVVGYQSSRPLPSGSAYHDRCDLAYARCRRVAQLLTTMNIESERLVINVAQTTGDPANTAERAVEPEDRRVDVYLTDTVAEKFLHGVQAP